MGFLTSRDGNLSPIRIGVLAGAVGLVVIVGGIVLSMFETSSLRQPLQIEPMPDAESLGRESMGPGGERIFFQTTRSPEETAAYYNEQMRAFYGPDEGDRCVRSPFDGEYSNYTPGNGVVPYEFRCLFSRAATGISGSVEQLTLVIIQPGVRNDAEGFDFTGTTRIEHEQSWQP